MSVLEKIIQQFMAKNLEIRLEFSEARTRMFTGRPGHVEFTPNQLSVTLVLCGLDIATATQVLPDFSQRKDSDELSSDYH